MFFDVLITFLKRTLIYDNRELKEENSSSDAIV